jgi:hypothetical protein
MDSLRSSTLRIACGCQRVHVHLGSSRHSSHLGTRVRLHEHHGCLDPDGLPLLRAMVREHIWIGPGKLQHSRRCRGTQGHRQADWFRPVHLWLPRLALGFRCLPLIAFRMGDLGDAVYGTRLSQAVPGVRVLHHVAVVVDYVLLAPLCRRPGCWQSP